MKFKSTLLFLFSNHVLLRFQLESMVLRPWLLLRTREVERRENHAEQICLPSFSPAAFVGVPMRPCLSLTPSLIVFSYPP